MNPLAIIPTYIRKPSDLVLTIKCLATLKDTSQVDIVVIDDKSPGSIRPLILFCDLNGIEFYDNSENSGFAKTINVGLRIARDEGRDAILVNADIEFIQDGWDERLVTDAKELNAYVMGAKLLFPNGTIQHAGIYYSILHRHFDHRFRLAPGNLPAADKPCICPVTGALQYISNEALNLIGLYDEEFRMGYEDVDYCLQIFKSGRSCVYNPYVTAIHHEQAFRGQESPDKKKRHDESLKYLMTKNAGLDFSQYVPTMLEV